MHFLSKIRSIVVDPRMPWRWPMKKLQYGRSKRTPLSGDDVIQFCFTVDFEHDFGSAASEKSLKGCNAFLKQFPQILQKIQRADIFVQGDLVEKYADELKNLSKREVCLGLHGYHHELWGKPAWFVKDTYISPKKRKALLKKGIRAFEEADLPEPKMFRAPNMIIDDDTKKLLTKHEIDIDSSHASYIGNGNYPYHTDGLCHISVSHDPQVSTKWKCMLPFSQFKVFNLYHTVTLPEAEFIALARRILGYQKYYEIPLHLVFLAHPWEFMNHDDKAFSYCSPENTEKLLKRLALLEKNFRIKYTSLFDIPIHERTF